mmetsp:Transcript_29792/g.35426  ORF Transcript_29792/g.35426 Transcript_29792/m.35426 type:complete len:92 (+) Transcript_29792:765-1040(+)
MQWQETVVQVELLEPSRLRKAQLRGTIFLGTSFLTVLQVGDFPLMLVKLPYKMESDRKQLSPPADSIMKSIISHHHKIGQTYIRFHSIIYF